MKVTVSDFLGPVFETETRLLKLPSVFKAVESLSKLVICALGSLFQAAKTLVKLPFAAILLPFAFVLGKVAKYCKNDAMKEFAEGMDLDFPKDLIMTIHLVHFTFSDKDRYSFGDVLRSTFEVLAGTEGCYRYTAQQLWSSYIYGTPLSNFDSA